MLLNVSQLLKEHSGARRFYRLDERIPPMDELPVGWVRGTVELLRTDKGIWVSAVLDSSCVCICSRCLAEYEQPLHMMVDEEFLPVAERNAGAGRVPDPFHETFYIDERNILDLTEAVRQYASISMPMKPICREDCAGLCARCGANLNESSCSCGGAPRVPRCGALASLVSKREGGE